MPTATSDCSRVPSKRILTEALVTANLAGPARAENVKLSGEGSSDTHPLINRMLVPDNNAVAVPDCKHRDFGPHITQVRDEGDDQRQRDDRQHDKNKVYDNSSDELKSWVGEVVTYHRQRCQRARVRRLNPTNSDSATVRTGNNTLPIGCPCLPCSAVGWLRRNASTTTRLARSTLPSRP